MSAAMATPIPANRAHFELAEIARATGGRLLGSSDIRCTSVSIDTRTLEAGALFVALRGAGDGHTYLAEAARRGASAAVVERGRAQAELPCVEVSDTLEALGQIAHQHLEELRSARPLPSIAIGG
ncbi:MAG TPA: Mur ligase domain-containing protein, partial [Candidatus Binataceae bacterium]|nr:Mur ligase domain-containing protein [Candidatus Binataceae bacterium]